MLEMFKTENEFGRGTVYSWASLLDEATYQQANKVSRSPAVEGYLALMPDAHFGYGPPVGSALKTRDSIMPYAVGADIGCGMIAQKLNLRREDFAGKEGGVLGRIRDFIPSGVGVGNAVVSAAWEVFVKGFGWPPGVDNVDVMAEARQRHHLTLGSTRDDLMKRARTQFATLGAGNHFVELSEDETGEVWAVLHSGSRGIGNALATAHHKLAQRACWGVNLESPDFAYFTREDPSFDDYIADMKWCQHYAFAQREAMMDRLLDAVAVATGLNPVSLMRINCHHNYAEELEPGLWLTRKGAINAEVDRMGIIPGSMGAATYIVRGKGCAEAYNTAPHGAGRLMARGAAKRTLSVETFKEQMEGKTWLDRDAKKLLDEAPFAYKPIAQVMLDSSDLVEPVAVLNQFVNYKGVL